MRAALSGRGLGSCRRTGPPAGGEVAGEADLVPTRLVRGRGARVGHVSKLSVDVVSAHRHMWSATRWSLRGSVSDPVLSGDRADGREASGSSPVIRVTVTSPYRAWTRSGTTAVSAWRTTLPTASDGIVTTTEKFPAPAGCAVASWSGDRPALTKRMDTLASGTRRWPSSPPTDRNAC